MAMTPTPKGRRFFVCPATALAALQEITVLGKLLKGELKVQTDRLAKALGTDVPDFNAQLKRVGLEPIAVRKDVVF